MLIFTSPSIITKMTPMVRTGLQNLSSKHHALLQLGRCSFVCTTDRSHTSLIWAETEPNYIGSLRFGTSPSNLYVILCKHYKNLPHTTNYPKWQFWEARMQRTYICAVKSSRRTCFSRYGTTRVIKGIRSFSPYQWWLTLRRQCRRYLPTLHTR